MSINRPDLNDLRSFVAVARLRSFTKAAAQLRVSQPALSHTIRQLELRMGVRLLTRTTRSVAPTQAGERVLRSVAPRLDEIESEIVAIRELREKPSGVVRLTATELAADTILLPKLTKVLRENPDIHVEIVVDYGLTNIVAQGFDAGVRSGEQVERDMIAVRIGPDMRMAVAGAASYFKKYGEPKRPQDLISHSCINLRVPTHGGTTYTWEFEKSGREIKVRVEGQMTCNTATQTLSAALSGIGLCYVPETMAARYFANGRLKRVLADWCPAFSGYHLYFPSSRPNSAAFKLVVEALTDRASR